MKTKKQNTHKILYQKLGSRWYVFADLEGEVQYTILPEGMNPYNEKFEVYKVLDSNSETTERNKFIANGIEVN